MKTRPTWTESEKEYVRKHYKDQTREQMADTLCKSVVAVSLFMTRHRIGISKLEKNIVQDLLRIKIVDPEYFRPTRNFYIATGINQLRWWNLYYGRAKMTTKEYLSVCRHLKIELVDAFEAHQIQLFPLDLEQENDK